ncbi:hypothetical protein BABINDRAFT_159128 [Babjeviella inositovora NRRL Y-12698]|uniref:GDT1 family protein n=1 Tax=Babjeviella inositovora NRRL Y-12698 TaxID=984486 RepID=A0A1E3QY71_9ASCO|nr:uncharacterized protein BABINDRAFT_159128 [Babjeviella inositovora NRRL Y-12698]ODQ82568.1 hypothetical protein BABINDRAFT_159128 [Babjeviella inositovora NRRL Y-12698]
MKYSQFLLATALALSAASALPVDGDLVAPAAINAAALTKAVVERNDKATDDSSSVDSLKGIVSGSVHKGKDQDLTSTSEEETSAYNSFFMSISMILVSEVGDKTFLIAALMAMRSSRLVVFTAAFSSLAVMTVLSGIVGHALPALIPQRATQFLASALFVIFGFKLVKEGLAMSKELGVAEEMAEVEEEIASSSINSRMDSVESGDLKAKSTSKSWLEAATEEFSNLAGFVFSPIWVQVFIMTFLGEWGDRSQIATIAMAAGSDYWYVILGAIIGHGICTGGAVIGGKLLASRISMRTVTLGGAVAFFVFAVLYFYEAMNAPAA